MSRVAGRDVPTDVSVALIVTALTWLSILLPVVRESPVRLFVGGAFLLFVPGWIIVAAIFPDAESTSGLTVVERAALAVITSVLVVLFVGMTLDLTPVGIRLSSLVVGISAIVVTGSVIVVWRRDERTAENRFSLAAALSTGTGARDVSRSDLLVATVLVVGAVLTLGSIGYVTTVPQDDEQFTTFTLGTHNESGAVVAGNYPDTLTAGSATPYVVTVDNHEGQQVRYAVVVVSQQVDDGGAVRSQTVLNRTNEVVAAGDSWQETIRVRLRTTGERRLAFLLYRGNSPDQPRIGNAYRSTSQWVNVTAS